MIYFCQLLAQYSINERGFSSASLANDEEFHRVAFCLAGNKENNKSEA